MYVLISNAEHLRSAGVEDAKYLQTDGSWGTRENARVFPTLDAAMEGREGIKDEFTRKCTMIDPVRS